MTVDQESTRCPICVASRSSVYLDGGDSTSIDGVGPARRATNPGRILRCLECGTGFRTAVPTDAELEELYARMDPTRYESEQAGRLKMADVHTRILRRYQTSGRLLDVGCASGHFLSAASEAGFEVVGVEPSEASVATARERLGGRGVVHHATLQESGLAASSFDCVTLWDVLEHVVDPKSFLSEVSALVRPGGCVLANVPDIGSMPARLLGSRWPLLLPEHLIYFTSSSLRAAGEACGLVWLGSGRRMGWFSLGYVLQRLAEHGVPASRWGSALARRAKLTIPVPLGEVYGVWRKPSVKLG